MFIIELIMLSFLNIFFGPKEGKVAEYMRSKEFHTEKTVYGFTMKDIDGESVNLGKYKGKVLLIVNVASKCGSTPQYEGMETFYKQYHDRGVEILAFPANNFGSQEPGTDTEIKEFCSKNYGVTFPVFSKISVKGDDMDPLYKFLTSKEENGILDAPVKWNFQKFLVDRQGRVVTFFDPGTKVSDVKLVNAIEALL